MLVVTCLPSGSQAFIRAQYAERSEGECVAVVDAARRALPRGDVRGDQLGGVCGMAVYSHNTRFRSQLNEGLTVTKLITWRLFIGCER